MGWKGCRASPLCTPPCTYRNPSIFKAFVEIINVAVWSHLWFRCPMAWKGKTAPFSKISFLSGDPQNTMVGNTLTREQLRLLCLQKAAQDKACVWTANRPPLPLLLTDEVKWGGRGGWGGLALIARMDLHPSLLRPLVDGSGTAMALFPWLTEGLRVDLQKAWEPLGCFLLVLCFTRHSVGIGASSFILAFLTLRDRLLPCKNLKWLLLYLQNGRSSSSHVKFVLS